MEIDINRIINYERSTNKVRLISIVDDEILVCNYDGYYMLPGGKIEKDEELEEALIREIKEETGNDINDYKQIITVNHYIENYISRFDSTPHNKKIRTTYYITDKKLYLTKKRKESPLETGHLNMKYIKIEDLIQELSTIPKNHKEKEYAKEILTIIKYLYKDYSLIDLHTHTTASDGQYSPNEVINQAISNHIKTIAITDHDTVKGLSKIDYNNPNIKIIPGIELTVKRPKGRMHILGLNIDYTNQELNDYLKEMKEINRYNLRNIINYLLEHNIKLDEQDIEKIFKKETNVGRPDVAKLLIKEGYVNNVQQAFDEYLVEAFLKTRKNNKGYSYDKIISLILNASGIPILAHPNSLELDNNEFEELLVDMINYGLKGLEIYHPNMNQQEREFYSSMVDKYNLLYSGGTDYHGEKVKEDIKLGLGRNNIYIEDLPILKKLNRRSY